MSQTTIIAENGVINNRKMFLINGQMKSPQKEDKVEVINFEQSRHKLKKISLPLLSKNQNYRKYLHLNC